MSAPLYHLVAIIVIGCVLGTAFSFTYPGIDINSSLALVIALVAIIIEGSAVALYRRIAGKN